MPKAIPRGPLIVIEGIEPRDDPAWALAGPRGHKAFYTFVAQDALIIKDKSLSKGLDIYGEKMVISEKTRQNRRSAMGPAYYRAPALTPSFEASRTRSYLRSEASETSATLWWRHDHRTKGSWGKILEYQRLSGRNVIGMSSNDLDRVYRNAMRWWQANRVRLGSLGAASNSGTRGGRLILNIPVAKPGTRSPIDLTPIVPGKIPTLAQMNNPSLTPQQRFDSVTAMFADIFGRGRRNRGRP